MDVAQVFDFDVVLNWVVDPKEYARGRGKGRYPLVHDNTDCVLGELVFARQESGTVAP